MTPDIRPFDMPIKFRCPHCEQFLGISRHKAGALTDCPTCGRTIRIPELDGTVQPLPGANLDLRNADLAQALDALAEIGRGGQRTATSQAPAPAAGVAVVAQPREVQPIPLPEPIPVEPSFPARPAGTLTAQSSAAGADSPRPAAAANDPLAQLAELSGAALPATYQRRHRADSVWTPTVLALLAGGGVLCFGLGLLTGRLTSGRTAVAPPSASVGGGDQGQSTAGPESPRDAETPAGLSRALTGRITFMSAEGEMRPDSGARILALPQQRQGSATVGVAGFRAGADDADQQLARVSLRALGGDFAIADDEGRYAIALPTAGQYQLLILSRHQPRDDADAIDSGLQQSLAAYFDRPTALIGAVQYHASTFRFSGAAAAPRDHAFDRP